MNRIKARPPKSDGVSLTLSVSEAAELLSVSRDLVYELVAQGELPALRLGRRILLPRRALEELVDRAATTNGENTASDTAANVQPVSNPAPIDR